MKTVFVSGIEGGSVTLEVEDFEKTTVRELKQRLKTKKSDIIPSDLKLEDMRLIFATKELCETNAGGSTMHLSDYNVQDKSTLHAVLRLPGGSDDPPQKTYESTSDFAHKFTTAKDVLDPYSEDGDEGPIRAKMSCGHAVTPEALTGWCRSLVDQNQFVLLCPAIVDQANNKHCGKEWPYEEVRQMALLNDSEMAYFERKLGEMAALKYFDAKECPECRSWVERKDLTNLRVVCPICTKKKGKLYEFCWNCLNLWSGPTTSGERCGSSDCKHPYLVILESSSKTIALVGGKIKNVPETRSCPHCGCLAQHNTVACKMMMCPRCRKEYCFACLLMKEECLRTSNYFSVCQKPVHPKQTTIASWNQQSTTRSTGDRCVIC